MPPPSVEEQRARRDEMVQSIVDTVESTEGWIPVKEKDGVQISYAYRDGEPLVYIKAVGLVPCPPRDAFLCVGSLEGFKAIDTAVLEARTLETISDSELVNYASFRLPFPLTPRDFVWYEYNTALPNGSFVSVAKSVLYPSQPHVRGCVRGEINASGYLLSPVPDRPNMCKVSYVVQVDPKGWVPHFVVNFVAADQGLNVLRLKEHFSRV